MLKIKFFKDYNEYKKGSILLVDNNIAHSFVDKEVAIVVNQEKVYKTTDFEEPPQDKMMRAKRNKNKRKNL